MATFADLDIRFHLSQGPDHRSVRLGRPDHLSPSPESKADIPAVQGFAHQVW